MFVCFFSSDFHQVAKPKKAAPKPAAVKPSAAKAKAPSKKNKEPEPVEDEDEDEEMEEKSEEEEKPKATASKKRAAPDSGFSETGKLLKILNSLSARIMHKETFRSASGKILTWI